MADVFDAIATHASERPDACALLTFHEALSYAQYDTAIRAAADNIHAWSIQRGACAGIAANANLDYVLLLFGLMHAGIIACPMNPRWPMQSILDALQALNATHLFVPSAIDARNIETRAVREIRVPASLRPFAPRETAESPCLCIFTSGSAGLPKAALHGRAGLSFSAETANVNIPLAPGDRWLLSLPLFHVAGIGILFRCALAGAAVAIPESNESIEDAILQYGVTHASLVATQLHRLLRTERGIDALSRLKAILLGGSAIPTLLIERAFALGLPIYTSYGMTETASQVATTRPDDSIERLFSSGRPLTSDTIRIAPDGEIQVRGASLFLGYLDNGRLERPLTDDGWFATGDRGSFDSDGYLHVSGRKDRLFISGGENVQPETIERCLCAIDGVTGAVVVPIADEEFGQLPVAFVLMEPALDADLLRAKLGEVLPRFQIPRRFLPWPEQLRGVEGKISQSLRQSLIDAIQ